MFRAERTTLMCFISHLALKSQPAVCKGEVICGLEKHCLLRAGRLAWDRVLWSFCNFPVCHVLDGRRSCGESGEDGAYVLRGAGSRRGACCVLSSCLNSVSGLSGGCTILPVLDSPRLLIILLVSVRAYVHV